MNSRLHPRRASLHPPAWTFSVLSDSSFSAFCFLLCPFCPLLSSFFSCNSKLPLLQLLCFDNDANCRGLGVPLRSISSSFTLTSPGLTPLECVVPKSCAVTPLECAVTKKVGGRGLATRFTSFTPSGDAGSRDTFASGAGRRPLSFHQSLPVTSHQSLPVTNHRSPLCGVECPA